MILIEIKLTKRVISILNSNKINEEANSEFIQQPSNVRKFIEIIYLEINTESSNIYTGIDS